MAYKFGTQKSSPYRGVGWHKRSMKWQAHIWYDGKLHHLGLFESDEKAARAYDEKAKEVWGADAELNFPVTLKGRRKASVVSPAALTDAIVEEMGKDFPTDPEEQRAAIKRVLAGLSQNNRAVLKNP